MKTLACRACVYGANKLVRKSIYDDDGTTKCWTGNDDTGSIFGPSESKEKEQVDEMKAKEMKCAKKREVGRLVHLAKVNTKESSQCVVLGQTKVNDNDANDVPLAALALA